MKKRIVWILILLLLLTGCKADAPFMPRAKNNKEIMAYAPILKEDFPIIKDKLEILRTGEIGKGGYSLYEKTAHSDITYMYVYLEGNIKKIEEYSFPQQELDAIDFLFHSEELQQHAYVIEYREPRWIRAIGSQGAMFASTESEHFHIGIFYFEDNIVPKELQTRTDYVEELEDNYWLVVCNMQRG